MDFLTKLSEERRELAEDDEEPLLGGCKLVEARYQDDKLLSQMHRIIHQPLARPPRTARRGSLLCARRRTRGTPSWR